ncbi:MAG TPA: hypothetical protein VFL91_08245 [Thermomicrobiales bacterium]|nr:hypothetical protein [Thermomicrobiales bacterium]
MPAFIPPPPPRRHGWEALPSYQPERPSHRSREQLLAACDLVLMVCVAGFLILLALGGSAFVVVAFAHWAAAGFPLS